MKKAIVVGSGISGCTCARALAENGYEVTVIEKLNHVGGNVYDELIDDIYVHMYGPHIFHTNDENVYKFLSKFTEWFPYEHKVLANIYGNYVPVPFNLTSLEKLYMKNKVEKIKKILIDEYGFGNKVPVMQLKQHKDKDIQEFGNFVLNKIFIHYTQKQWGRKIEELDPNVMQRVPVYISYEDKYFTDKFQCQPKLGFTQLINNMLNHKNIKILKNVDANDVLELKDGKIFYKNQEFNGKVIFTGAVDEFCNYKFGELPYRSLVFKFKKTKKSQLQPCAVVNYTVNKKYTRISEFKKFTTYKAPEKGSIYIKEYPLEFKRDKGLIRYYPIVNEKSTDIFNKYKKYLSNYSNFYVLGRLGDYKYINMDIAVKNALDLANDIIEGDISKWTY